MAAEAGVSRAVVTKWYRRWKEHGDRGLLDVSSKPGNSPTAIDQDVVDLIVKMRREQKWGPARIAAMILQTTGLQVAPATVHRTLVRQGLNRLSSMDMPTGESARGIVRYEHDAALPGLVLDGEGSVPGPERDGRGRLVGRGELGLLVEAAEREGGHGVQLAGVGRLPSVGDVGADRRQVAGHRLVLRPRSGRGGAHQDLTEQSQYSHAGMPSPYSP